MQSFPGISLVRILLVALLIAPITVIWSGMSASVEASSVSSVVCIHSKTKSVRTHIVVKKKKQCPKGEKKRTWNAQTIPTSVCVHSTTRQLLFYSKKCPKKTKTASSYAKSNSQTIPVCIGRTNRIISRRIGTKCPSSARRSTFITYKAPLQQNPAGDSTTPPVQFVESAPSTTAPSSTTTTTPPTTTTTIPVPQVSLTSTSHTIVLGASTNLVASFDEGTATINQGVGSVLSGQAISISPTVTTIYDLEVTIGSITHVARHYVYVNSLAITQHPTNSTITNGNGVVVRVNTSSTGVLAFTWYRDGIEVLRTASDSFFATSAGQYHALVVSTLNGVSTSEVSLSATVDINDLSVVAQPEGVTIGDSDIARLVVGATGTGTLSYQWYFNDTLISGANLDEYSTSTGGTYFVEVTNTISGTSRTVRSNIVFIDQNRVNITAQPVDSGFTTGGDVVLAIAVSVPHNTTMTYQWYLNNQQIQGANEFSYRANQPGSYRAAVTSERNGTQATVFTDTATVSEVAQPEITSLVLGDASIGMGQSTTLTAVFSNGTAVLTPGNIALTSGVPHTVSPASSTTFAVSVRNSLNYETQATIELIVTTGQFTVTANNATGDRSFGSTSVKLLNGKVLIFGSGYNYNRTGDLFDPATNIFTATGSLRIGRSVAPGVLLDDGRVLVAGGYNGSTSLASTEIYDPNTGQFSDTGFMNFERRNHSLVKLNDGRIMALGGVTNNASNNYTSSVEIYNPATGTWTLSPAMIFARSQAVAVLLHDGRVLIAGGYNSVQGHQKTAEIYNPSTNQFTLLSSQMNIARSGASIIATPQGAVIIAGQQGSTLLSRFEIFSSDTNTFASVVPELEEAVSVPGIAMRTDGVIVIFGGVNSAVGFYTRGYLFDPANNRLVNENVELPIYRSNSTATTLDDGRILFVGGNYNERTSAVIYSY